ncbi:MAG: TetR/AcrR family transcriptional regulator [Clostridia bacterium]|nr:TetR/AcrR family transcriptional regulator [Clostridia bacterium]
MKKNEKQIADKRVVRTRKAIIGAFTELLAEKNLNLITVKDIAERANINRKTFYNYYNGIYEVIEEVERELIDKFDVCFANLDLVSCLDDSRLIFDRIDLMINSDLELFSNLFNMSENVDITTKITSIIKEKTKGAICSGLGFDENSADIALEYGISGMVSVYQMWFRSDRKIPLSEISDMIGVMSFDGIKGLMTRRLSCRGQV